MDWTLNIPGLLSLLSFLGVILATIVTLRNRVLVLEREQKARLRSEEKREESWKNFLREFEQLRTSIYGGAHGNGLLGEIKSLRTTRHEHANRLQELLIRTQNAQAALEDIKGDLDQLEKQGERNEGEIAKLRENQVGLSTAMQALAGRVASLEAGE